MFGAPVKPAIVVCSATFTTWNLTALVDCEDAGPFGIAGEEGVEISWTVAVVVQHWVPVHGDCH